jgi:hypothetical protein
VAAFLLRIGIISDRALGRELKGLCPCFAILRVTRRFPLNNALGIILNIVDMVLEDLNFNRGLVDEAFGEVNDVVLPLKRKARPP